MFNKIPGWFNQNDFIILKKLAKKIPENGTMVELGSFVGRSAVAWANTVKSGVKIYCVDSGQDFIYSEEELKQLIPKQYGNSWTLKEVTPKWDNFIKNIRNYNNIIPIKGRSPYDIEWDNDNKIDLVFIDMAHTRQKEFDDNINFWWDHLADDGILCGHDFRLEEGFIVCPTVLNFSNTVDRPVLIINSNFWIIFKDETKCI